MPWLLGDSWYDIWFLEEERSCVKVLHLFILEDYIHFRCENDRLDFEEDEEK